MSTVEDAAAWNPYTLAGMAGCASPDRIAENGGEDSPGAALLRSVLVDTLERVDYVRQDGTAWAELPAAMDDAVAEIADAAPDVYTFTRWQEFADLAAWQEDPSELGADWGDMTACAGVCLYMIAERLARAIVEALAEQDDDEEDEEEPEADEPAPADEEGWDAREDHLRGGHN